MKAGSYKLFRQKIHSAARNKGFPLRVMFELTYECNFYCRHCYVPLNYRKKQGQLTAREIFLILRQLRDAGCFYLGFTGGEPFIREDILDILSYAKKLGFEIIIYTNGSLINNDIADKLSALRPNKVDITIPAMSEPAFEKITQLPGSHKKVFNAIDLLHKRRVALGFKTCVLNDNESEIADIQKFAKSLGALHRIDDMLLPRLDGARDPFKYRGILPGNSRNSACIEASECVGDNDSSSRHFAHQDIQLFQCGSGISQAAITPLGELKICLMIDYPKYKILGEADKASRKNGFENAWQRLKKLVVDIKPDAYYYCDKCDLEQYCKWCPARAWLYNKTFTVCDPECLKKAKYIKNQILRKEKECQ
jgi:MoaA/NifB/PqqE/SkfB family radical SAM enzyme